MILYNLNNNKIIKCKIIKYYKNNSIKFSKDKNYIIRARKIGREIQTKTDKIV